MAFVQSRQVLTRPERGGGTIRVTADAEDMTRWIHRQLQTRAVAINVPRSLHLADVERPEPWAQSAPPHLLGSTNRSQEPVWDRMCSCTDLLEANFNFCTCAANEDDRKVFSAKGRRGDGATAGLGRARTMLQTGGKSQHLCHTLTPTYTMLHLEYKTKVESNNFWRN